MSTDIDVGGIIKDETIQGSLDQNASESSNQGSMSEELELAAVITDETYEGKFEADADLIGELEFYGQIP